MNDLLDPRGLDAFFRPLLAAWGVRHGVADTGSILLLGVVRWVLILQFCAFLGGRLVPGPVKTGLAMMMAWFTAPWVSQQLPVPLDLTPVGWWIALLHEVWLGFVIGLASSLVFFAADMAGQLLDSTRGTSMASVLVPQLQTQTSIMGELYFQLFIVLYLLVGGHRWFLEAILDSYALHPPLGAFPDTAAIQQAFLSMTVSMFGIMLKIVAPAMLVLILLDVVLGVTNRMAPQLDVFFLGMAVKPVAGLLVVAISIYALLGMTPATWTLFQDWMSGWMLRSSPIKAQVVAP